ncbi:hypothetical protein JXA12_02160 [Candidatus Woesearchaeota archaeon]|nr:hypothetical protein [Candidatus Woesearchaeota archaeon]
MDEIFFANKLLGFVIMLLGFVLCYSFFSRTGRPTAEGKFFFFLSVMIDLLALGLGAAAIFFGFAIFSQPMP